MAKDGTARGGRRTGAGAKSKQSKATKSKVVEAGSIAKYLEVRGLKGVVPQELIDSFDQAFLRWKEAEKGLEGTGLLAPHPTTGAEIAHPLVSVSCGYQKTIASLWSQIYQLIGAAQANNKEDEMEGLLDG